MGIDTASLWTNLFLNCFEFKHVQQFISLESPRPNRYHGISRFIDCLCTVNVNAEFFSSFKKIYSK